MFDALRALVSRFDMLLRRQGRVQEFTKDGKCILRIAVGLSHRDLELSDGTKIQPGQEICELHFWNEHMPTMSREGPDLKWGLEFYRLAVRSFRSLAAHMASEQSFANVMALQGELALPSGESRFSLVATGSQLGFDVVDLTLQAGRWGRFKHFWENIYSWALMWAFNPGSLKRKRFLGLHRYEFWISRKMFFHLYGAQAGQFARKSSTSTTAASIGKTRRG